MVWRVKSYFESPFVCQEQKDVASYFFVLESKWELSNEGFKNILKERYKKNTFEDAYNIINDNNLTLEKKAKMPSEIISVIKDSTKKKIFEVDLSEVTQISHKSLLLTEESNIKKNFIKKNFHKALAYLWGKGEIYQEFDYVIYLSLMQWKEGGLKSLIRDSYYSLDEELLPLNIKEKNQHILFLFDDIDMLAIQTEKLDNLKKEINEFDLKYYTFISSATSRKRGFLDRFEFDESFDLNFIRSNDNIIKKENISFKIKVSNYLKNYFDSSNSQFEIFTDKNLYSKDIEGTVLFDIVIELSFPLKLIIIVKCFDTHENFTLMDIQNFYRQKNEVNAQKIIIVSSNSFEDSIIQYAKNKNADIGLLHFDENNNPDWILKRSSSLLSNEEKNIKKPFESPVSYAFSKGERTNSLTQFMVNLLSDTIKFSIPAKYHYEKVQFLNEDSINQTVNNLLDKINYRDGLVDLNKITNLLQQENNLNIRYNQALNKDILGEIDFQQSLITIDNHQCETLARLRFTVAHEIGHYCLGHARYMFRERFTQKHEENIGKKLNINKEIAKMEWQANQFASFLLLPIDSFQNDINSLLQKYDVKNKGFGLLFVDSQRCNTEIFYKITSELMQKYKVSRMVIEIRLRSLGILHKINTYKLIANTYHSVVNQRIKLN